MGYEKIVADALLGKISVEEATLAASHLYAVQRAIFCGGCNSVLDVRTSVYVEVKDGTKQYIVCGKCFDTGKEKLAPVIDKLLIHHPRKVRKAK